MAGKRKNVKSGMLWSDTKSHKMQHKSNRGKAWQIRKRGRNKQAKHLICRDPVTAAWLSHIKEGKGGTGRYLWPQFLIPLFCFLKISSDQ